MKNALLRFGLVLISLFSFSLLKAQQITITGVYGSSTPANPVSVCQCDTLGVSANPSNGVVKPELKYDLAGAFSSLTKFYYEMASPNNNWSTADSLELFSLTGTNDATPVDTFALGGKEAQLVVPCTASLGAATLRIRNSNGEISDTAYILINKFPAKPIIDSINGGYPNPYTTGVDDWGFCQGDSIVLYAEQQAGASYQWLESGAPLVGETNDSLVIKSSGNYAVRIDFGACARDSKDTVITVFLPPTLITLQSLPPAAYQIDNPGASGFPLDSVQFCENSSAILAANDTIAGTGLTYTYTWITDSITQFGDTIYYMRDPGDTLRLHEVDTSGRFYVVIYDGFCTDTSAPYFAFMDTVPVMPVQTQIYDGGLLGPKLDLFDVCMRDSIVLNAGVVDPDWGYQWQRLNTSLSPPTWVNLPDVNNPDLVGDQPTLVVDTSIKPIQSLSYYRLKVFTLTPQGAEVCTYFTDSVRVRWFPEYELTFQASPFVNNVGTTGTDSINFCETDSAVLVAPATPSQLISNGLFYDYQWLRDSTDTATGTVYKVPVANGTFQNVKVFEGGKYYVAIDDGICIDTSDAMWVFVDSLPKTTITTVNFPGYVSDQNLCLIDSTQISAVDTILPGWNYQWQLLTDTAVGFQNLPNDTFPWLIVDTAYKPSGADTLYFRLLINYENQFGLITCPEVSDTFQVNFYDPPTLSFIPGSNVEICEGDSILVVASGNFNSVTWSNGDIGSTTYLSQAGNYWARAVGINGCITYDTVVATFITTTANAGPDVTALSGEQVVLSGSGGTDYYWSANKPVAWSGILSQTVSVSYTLPEGVEADTITVYLEVTSADGCTDTDSLTLIIRTPEDEDISLINRAWNFFSPNNDGKNDVWDITSIVNEYNGCRIDILNRWGSVVYNQEDFNGVWEGNDKGGSPLPDGTYYYILSCDGEIILKNAVTFIRNK